jgi:hypothetical protein
MRTLPLISLLGTLFVFGCSSEPGNEAITPSSGFTHLDPPAAGSGVQFKMVTSLPPGLETERCKLFKAPPEGMFVNREEARFTQGSHHILLYTTAYADIPTKNIHGVEVDTSDVVDCPNGATADWEVTRVLGGSQSFEGESLLNTLPEGVAVKFEPGTVLLMNVHYLNATPGEIETDARINLYTIPKEEVKHEAGLLFYYNPFIHVPAGGESSARMRCAVNKDIEIINVQSHMHKRGVNYVANLTDGAGTKIQEVYTNDSWEDVPVGKFSPTLSVKAGQAIDYRCDYANTEARDVIQGPTTKDEMCMLIGAYYPRDPMLEVCRDSSGVFDAIWTGNGSRGGADTAACLRPAKLLSGEYYGCVVNSCPEIADEVSALVKCHIASLSGACATACGTDVEACEACAEKACEAPAAAAAEATCD